MRRQAVSALRFPALRHELNLTRLSWVEGGLLTETGLRSVSPCARTPIKERTKEKRMATIVAHRGIVEGIAI